MDISTFNTGIISVRVFFFILPFIIATFHCLWKKQSLGFSKSECFFAYFLVICVGLQGVLLGHLEIFHPEIVAAYLGFPDSPFLPQVGKAHFTLGTLGILCFWFKNGWREATAVGNALFFFLLSMGHFRTLMSTSDAPHTLRLVMFSDLFVALLLVILLTIRRTRIA